MSTVARRWTHQHRSDTSAERLRREATPWRQAVSAGEILRPEIVPRGHRPRDEPTAIRQRIELGWPRARIGDRLGRSIGIDQRQSRPATLGLRGLVDECPRSSHTRPRRRRTEPDGLDLIRAPRLGGGKHSTRVRPALPPDYIGRDVGPMARASRVRIWGSRSVIRRSGWNYRMTDSVRLVMQNAARSGGDSLELHAPTFRITPYRYHFKFTAETWKLRSTTERRRVRRSRVRRQLPIKPRFR
jgi:hypothetical protein